MCEKGQTHDRRLDSGGKVCAHGQESLLRITSPVTGDVVPEGQPLRITVAADASVHVVGVLAGNPLRKLVSWVAISLNGSFLKPFPPAIRCNGSGPGLDRRGIVASFDSRGERGFCIELQVQPPLPGFAELGDKFPLRVYARFADGSNLDVTHSGKVTFTRKSRDCQSR
jgi:hypothetical protein